MIADLERRLKVHHQMDHFEANFDRDYPNFDTNRDVVHQLRDIRKYVHEKKDLWEELFKNSLLNSSHCLVYALLAHLLAFRKGIQTEVVRPQNLTTYFHAMLVYDSGEGKQVMKITGRPHKQYEWQGLSSFRIEQRLRYMTPVTNLVNYVWCRD